MTLRTRLSLLLALLTVVALLIGMLFVVHNSRVAVEAELRSASDLTVQLVEASMESLTEMEGLEISADDLLYQIEGLGAHRHIRLDVHEGAEPPPPADAPEPRSPDAPAWFTYFVKPPVASFHRTVPVPTADSAWFVVHAEPADEITEAWQAARGLLAVLLGFAIGANLIIYFVVNRALRPLNVILRGLDDLEHGNYTSGLPEFSVPEFNSVSRQFNRLSSALDQSRARVRRLNRQILEVQEDERRHLARELHDELGQCMSAIRAEAAAIRQATTPDNGAVRDGAAAIARTAGQVYDIARNMIHRLHPAALEELGLEAGIRQMVSDWSRRNRGIQVDLHLSDGLEQVPPALAIHIYRAVQECLTNISRHADATRVTVSVNRRSGTIQAEVRDNGRGFETEAGGSGFGLLGIRERLAGLGGSVSIDSRPGQGVRVRMTAPERESASLASAG
ncbi:histidine kinase [Methylonatrum kenyense]|uniref:ATP-binding protein n=1 Tax=Methylonatrum kenyense TaxID=455253 RepID=UPI0020C145E0|nr:ATP-binding protein [Methylonatrum kenyense]MCK8517083.1 histidine kinase [Methylonatrum kenyense]